VREVLKANGLLGVNDTTVQVLDRLNLTNAQKRDERFYPQDAVIVFNQKVHEAKPGSKGTLAAILKSSLVVEVDRKFHPCFKQNDRPHFCVPAARTFNCGRRPPAFESESQTRFGSPSHKWRNCKSQVVHSKGEVELSDGRILDKSFREFLPGYAVTSYG